MKGGRMIQSNKMDLSSDYNNLTSEELDGEEDND